MRWSSVGHVGEEEDEAREKRKLIFFFIFKTKQIKNLIL